MSVRLSTSTLGAPDVDLDTLIGWLRDAGIDGVELRVSGGQLAEPGMPRAAREVLRTRLSAAGITVTGLASYVRIAAPTPDEVVVGALAAAIQLAADLGAPHVRVFPGAGDDVDPADRDSIDARAADRLDQVAALAGELEVRPVLETHDSHPRGADVAAVLARCSGPVGAVWDLMHPWRAGEELDATWDALAPWLVDGHGSVQVKDAASPDLTPVAVGAGSLPTDEFAALLRTHDYDGVVCLEWEKAWHPAAAELPVALASTTDWARRGGLHPAVRTRS